MSIESELLAIKGDRLWVPPKEVVLWAKAHPNSMLYRRFNWDATEAAMEHWIWQARVICASVNIRIVEDGPPVRRFVSLSIDRINGSGYRDIMEIKDAPDLREVMLTDALAELDRIKAKYEHLTELARVWEEADKVRAQPRRRRARPPQIEARA